jgi:PHD/YefM family antitoxin component YafN of YafNO toxin-antitoxin module
VGRRRTEAGVEEYVDIAERLRPYHLDARTDDESQRAPVAAPNAELLDELMERAVNLLTLMSWNQRRETIEDLLSPHDLARGRRAVDALIEAAFVAEDDTGHLHLLR